MEPTPAPPAAEGAEALLRIVAGLAAEAQPHRPPPRVALDSALERELGLDSLARAELLLRIEAELGVALPPRVLAEAETPRDLVRALAAARAAGAGATIGDATDGPAVARPGAAAEPATSATSDAPAIALAAEEHPDRAATLPAVVQWHAERHGERRHVLFLDGEGGEEPLSYAELLARATRVARALVGEGLGPGDAVALMLPSGLEYFACFLGAQLAGGVPVPLYPPARPSQVEDHLRRQAGILRNARVRTLIAAPEVRALARLLRPLAPDLRAVTTPAALLAAAHGEPLLPPVKADDVAFLQYTSGSTGEPKGVVLTHANLLANLRSIGRAVRLGYDDVVVSWLPLYHDMGLIGAWMGSLYFGMSLVLMSPLTFLARPQRWLEALTRFGGTVAAAPNFAYALCLRRVPDEALAGLDLARWRIAMNGAEPVSPDALEGFARRFAACGLRREALMPVYGLAENSLALAFPPVGRGPRVEALDRRSLQRDGVAAAAGPDDPQPLRVVSCGHAVPEHEIRVVDGRDRELPERREGRLQFRGPSATRGYFRNPEATARLVAGDGWLDSGDLGFLLDGEVFVTGRRKDLIIRGGRNLHPQELEDAVGRLPGLRRGCVAVFAVHDEAADTERLVVLAERAAGSDTSGDEALRQEVSALALELTGSAPDEVALVPPGTVPKTSSGKIRRTAARERWRAGVGRRRGVRWQVLRLAAAGLPARLRRAARGAGELAWAAWAFLALLLVAGTTCALVVALPGRTLRRRAGRGGLRLLARACGVPLAVRGLERLPAGPCVLVSNHQSYVDGFLLGALLPPRFGYVVKSELARHAWTRLPLARLGAVFVERFDAERGAEDARRAEAVVARGDALVVFPEGTFRRAPGLLPFRLGAFQLAARTGVPVVPAVLHGSRNLLRAGQWLPRRAALAVHVGEPIAPAGGEWKDALRLRDAARRWMLDQAGEPDLSA